MESKTITNENEANTTVKQVPLFELGSFENMKNIIIEKMNNLGLTSVFYDVDERVAYVYFMKDGKRLKFWTSMIVHYISELDSDRLLNVNHIVYDSKLRTIVAYVYPRLRSE